MRFRRSVRLCKGIRMNFSGSGVTMSLGMPGASITFGKSGAYVNYGIPGTGLYNRKKIAGPTPKSRQSRNISDTLLQYRYEVDIADNGQTSIEVYDSMGNRITNSSIISKIRKTSEYKAKVEELIRTKRDSINSQSLQFIRIYKQSEKLVNFDDIRDSYAKLCTLPNPESYFDTPSPSENEVRVKLEKEAEVEIKSILFWTNTEKRKAYVEEKFPSAYQASIDEWNALKAEFIESELAIRNAEKERIEKLLQTNITEIYSAIDEVLENITYANVDKIAKDNGLNLAQANAVKDALFGLFKDLGVVDTRAPEEAASAQLELQKTILGDSAAEIVKDNTEWVKGNGLFSDSEKDMLVLAAEKGNPLINSVLHKFKTLFGKSDSSDIPVNNAANNDGLPTDAVLAEEYKTASDARRQEIILSRIKAGRKGNLPIGAF